MKFSNLFSKNPLPCFRRCESLNKWSTKHLHFTTKPGFRSKNLVAYCILLLQVKKLVEFLRVIAHKLVEHLFHLNLIYSKKKLELLCFLLNCRSVGIKPWRSLEPKLHLLLVNHLQALIGIYQLGLSSHLWIAIGAVILGLVISFSLPKNWRTHHTVVRWFW